MNNEQIPGGTYGFSRKKELQIDVWLTQNPLFKTMQSKYIKRQRLLERDFSRHS